MKKRCAYCRRNVKLGEFTTCQRSLPYGKCRKCTNALARLQYNTPEARKRAHERYEAKKVVSRNAKLRRDYGISLDEYNVMLAEQDGRCAICGKTPEENTVIAKALAVDHNHDTNVVRGLLCANCNVAVGFIEDAQKRIGTWLETVEKMGDYLGEEVQDGL